jgi:WD40 repeat protein
VERTLSDCPSDRELRDVLAGTLAGEKGRALEFHVATCPGCQDRLHALDAEAHRSGQGVSGEDSGLTFLEALKDQPPLGRPGPDQTAEESALRFPGPPTREGPLGQLGRYHIVRELGRGGFGFVFEAYDERLRCRVAVKVLRPELAAGAAHRGRFLREARVAAAVNHDHVVTVHHVEDAPDFPLPYIVMEYLDGETLSARLDREGPLPPRTAAELARQVASGLAAVHGRGIVHRDVKPSNIILEATTDRAKITDFGVARLAEGQGTRLTESGALAGTPTYMSPEQALGSGDLDERSDVYSLGVVLFELLTGQVPHKGPLHEVLRQVLHGAPKSPRALNTSVPPALAAIVVKCLARKPYQRYRSAASLADDLQRFLRGEKVRADVASPWWRTAGRVLDSRYTQAALAGTALVALVLAIVPQFWKGTTPANAPSDGPSNPSPAAPSPYLKAVLDTGAGHQEVVRGVTFSPDGARMASIDRRGAVLLWDARTGERVAQLSAGDVGPDDTLYAVTFSPNGKALSAVAANRITTWDLAQPTAPKQGFVYGGFPRSPSVLSNDVVVNLNDEGHVSLSDPWRKVEGQDTLGKTLNSRRIARLRGSISAKIMAVGRGGRKLATSGRYQPPYDVPGQVITLWDVPLVQKAADEFPEEIVAEEGTALTTTAEVSSLAFNPDCTIIAAGSKDGTVRMWDVTTREELSSRRMDGGPVSHLAFAPDGKTLAAGTATEAKVWDVARGEQTIHLPAANPGALTLSPDGRLAVTEGSTIRLCDGEGKSLIFFPGRRSPVQQIAFQRDRTLHALDADGRLTTWDLSGSNGGMLIGRDFNVLACARVGWERIVVAGASAIRIFPFDERWRTIGEINLVTHMAATMSPEGDDLLALAAGNEVSVWHLGRRQRITTFTGGSSARITTLAFHRTTVVTGGADGTVRVWDARSGKERHRLASCNSEIAAVAVSPNGKTVAATIGRSVRLWEAEGGQEVGTLAGPSNVTAVAFSPNGRVIAIGGEGRIVLSDVASGKETANLDGHTGPIRCLEFHSEGKWLASGSDDGTARIWIVPETQE